MQNRSPIARIFGILIALLTAAAVLASLLARSSQADQQRFTLAPGDELTVECTSVLNGEKLSDQSVVLRCQELAPTAAPTQAPTSAPAADPGLPSIVEVRGVTEGQDLAGSVAIEAIASGPVARVIFTVDGSGAMEHTERVAPYFLMGDNAGTPNGWNTTMHPDGNYRLTVMACRQDGQCGTPSITHFRIINIVGPTLTAISGDPTATSVPATAVVPTATSVPPAATAVPPTATAGSGNTVPVSGQLCPQWVHDSYTTTGPDGKTYPTWHPTVDPTYGCYFDHEHGDDPRTWKYFNEVGMPPFGYVNAIEGQRKEDHVGNKVFVVNDDGRGGSVMAKVHQGTHSPDAFTNNLHELHYHYRNVDGRRLDIRILASFGASGQITLGCGANSSRVVTTGSPTNSFTTGARVIPDASCFNSPNIPYEDWLSGNHIRMPNGTELAYFDPHFAVFNPSRIFDPNQPNSLRRSVDLGAPNVAWDSVDSPYRGNKREMYVNQNWVTNNTGVNVWYCDPYGGNASSTPFPGSVPQYISSNQFTTVFQSRVFGADTVHDGPGVRAPN